MENIETPEGWREFACQRIEKFRTGECDFDGLFLAFELFVRAYESGFANPRPAVRLALYELMAVIRPYAESSASSPPAAAFERQLLALQDALGCAVSRH